MTQPVFPPLLSGHPVQGGEDPFERAQAMAALGCDAGSVVYNIQADRLRVAIVFAPEVPLQDAMAMLPLCAVGFQNALGALAPPEVAVHLGWDGLICVNGAKCGAFRVAASTAPCERRTRLAGGRVGTGADANQRGTGRNSGCHGPL